MSIERARHPCPEDRDQIACDFCDAQNDLDAAGDLYTLIPGSDDEHFCGDCRDRAIGWVLRAVRDCAGDIRAIRKILIQGAEE